MGRLIAYIAAILFAPFHLIIAALIFLDDRGPVFYKCQRLGKDGRPFAMFKYRSMRVGSAAQVDAGFKTVVTPEDPRVTRIGRLLRRGIDEIPQLLNIIRGEMAWIGPRPDEPWMLPHYGPAIRERLSVLPGITGLAQVSGSRNLKTERTYALEIWGLRHRSAALSLRIVAMTLLFMLGWRSKGAPDNTELFELEQACERELVCS